MMTRFKRPPAPPPPLCPCGKKSVWRRGAFLSTPERAPEGAVCFLTDTDFFADDYCEKCFAENVPGSAQTAWQRLTTEEG